MLLRSISSPFLVACALLTAVCAKPGIPPLTATQTPDRSVLAGEWEYEDADIYGVAIPLTLDRKGKGHYQWKNGRFETHSLIGRTWRGKWSQKENDRDGGFTVEFSPDFSEGEGRWWYTRIGTDYAPTQKGGAFHLMKKGVLNQSKIH